MPLSKVIVLAPGPKEDIGRFADFQSGMYLGGQIRMDAAAAYAIDNPETEFTVVGGFNKIGEGDTDISNKVNDMAAFLLANVPDIIVQRVPSLPCTRHNFVAILNQWALKDQITNQVGILTNGYHLDRAAEFAKLANSDIGNIPTIDFVPLPAEDILGKSIESIIGDHTNEYEARIKSEQNGLAQLRNGTYVDSCLHQNLQSLLPVVRKQLGSLVTNAEQVQLLSIL